MKQSPTTHAATPHAEATKKAPETAPEQTAAPKAAAPPETAPPGAASVPRGSAVMAAGSVVARATGFARSAVVAAALGTIGPTADGYAVGNALPTIVYMLLLGGALNAVFVPELVRAAKEHADGERRTPTGSSPSASSPCWPSPRPRCGRRPRSSTRTRTTAAGRPP
ncbi:hypothetical protein Smic_36650 [Streptomyces microflavus]|uniref:Murein biosynthesis integral membrane protein MurJ n=1 Tax=Streptomyces microflavus TaxID=1919 RepID=A0A7J0CS33_STRMI|nr:hypothetical protein Smic_36650 [Streptomyces microflavus]